MAVIGSWKMRSHWLKTRLELIITLRHSAFGKEGEEYFHFFARLLGLHIPATKGGASDLLTAHFSKPSPEQVAILERMGLEIPSTREEASALITANIDKPTTKQIAKLEYMGRKVPRTKERAAELLDEIEDDPVYEEKRTNWDLEKYDLHPDLYDETDEEMWKRIRQQKERADTKKYIQRILRSDKKRDAALVCVVAMVIVIFVGALGGSAICALLFILSVLGFIFHFWRKKKKARELSSDPPPLPHNHPPPLSEGKP